MEDLREVQLFDANTSQIYKIRLTKEDAERVENDIVYAATIMNNIKKQVEMKMTSPHPKSCKRSLLKSPDSNIAEETSQTTKGDDIHLWTEEETSLLLATYKEKENIFKSSKLRKKDCWKEITKTINEILVEKNLQTLTWEKCLSKMESLKRTYKNIKDQNKKSGNSRHTWKYFDIMNDIFVDKPWMEPLATAGTDVMKKEKTDEEPPRKKKPPRSVTFLKDVLQKRKEDSDKKEADKHARHVEKMGVLREMITLMRSFNNGNAILAASETRTQSMGSDSEGDESQNSYAADEADYHLQ